MYSVSIILFNTNIEDSKVFRTIHDYYPIAQLIT